MNIKNNGNKEITLFKQNFIPLPREIIINGITQEIISYKYIFQTNKLLFN